MKFRFDVYPNDKPFLNFEYDCEIEDVQELLSAMCARYPSSMVIVYEPFSTVPVLLFIRDSFSLNSELLINKMLASRGEL